MMHVEMWSRPTGQPRAVPAPANYQPALPLQHPAHLHGLSGAAMGDLAALSRDYRVAFLRYLPHHEEAALARAYELGRQSLTAGISLLDVLTIHHTVLTDLLDGTADQISATVAAAGAFLAELLAPYDMVQRGLLDRRQALATPA